MESENKAVAVIQADRDAAAALAEQIAGPTNGKDQIAQCREGKQDDTHLVQTLARHRLAHQRPQGEVVGTVPCPMCRAPAIREETPPYVVTVQDEHGEEYEENRLGTARYRYAHPAPEPAGDLVEMIEQLHQLARKQEGYGMSFHDPAGAPRSASINLYGDRARAAIWLFKNADRIADALAALRPDDAREENAKLREAAHNLDRYASHKVGCAIYQRSWVSGEPECTCGLDQARKALGDRP